MRKAFNVGADVMGLFPRYEAPEYGQEAASIITPLACRESGAGSYRAETNTPPVSV